MKLFTWNKMNKKKDKLKYKIRVQQNQDQLSIKGIFNRKNYQGHELWLFSRETGEREKIDDIVPSNEFNFNVSLGDLIATLKKIDGTIFDWYFRVITPYSAVPNKRKKSQNIKTFEENKKKYAEYFIRAGRFQYSQIEGLNFYFRNDDSVINYVTRKGSLSVILNDEPKTPTKIQIDRLRKSGSTMYIEGKLFARNSIITYGEAVLKGRNTNLELSTSQVVFEHLKEDVEKKYGLNRYKYTVSINFNDVKNGYLLDEDTYDLFLKLNLHDKHELKYIRIGRPTFRSKFFIKDLYAKDNKEAMIVNPYFTFRKSNFSFEVYKYPIENFKYLRRVMRWSWLIRLFNMRKNTWLVGERVHKAQDTGFAFFRYLRTKHPEKNVFYVIDSDSPEKKNVEEYGNVLEFKSKKHIWYSIIAKKVISSHHPDYLYPIRTNTFKRKVKADKIFLQHGVIAMKNVVANYGKNSPGFETDYFMVSSDLEKDIIVNDYGYDRNKVFVTGLSRFDSLFKDDISKKRQILIIPTWRDWIVTDEAFFESEYYMQYEHLINDQYLHELANEYEFQIILCLHPNMLKFSKYFENPSVQVINQGDVNVQNLIKESALMITDYSSVGFDFVFLNKPVIFYHFDRTRFIGKRRTHIEFGTDLPGEVAFDAGYTIDLVEEYAKNDFRMKPVYERQASKFIKYKDQSNSERIYEVINNNKVHKSFLENPKLVMLREELYKRFRKSKYYFPVMKRFYTVGSKVIPVDKKLILFESGLGKQYGDNPRMIYEEIVNRNLDYRKVWIYNKPHRFSDPNTIRVKRLSPKYYYFLFRAGYWVNSQNFPTYIKKRRQITYLQTWHGTPLKKMLYDIQVVYGRTDDYVERVGSAVKNWDYLISPSKYATNAFRSAFRYDGDVLEVGYPRNDVFYSDDKKVIAKKVRDNLNIAEGKKVILYAPTFRDDQTIKTNKFLFNINMDLEIMKERLSDEYVILIRQHVVISNKLKIDESLDGFAYNVSNYPDIQELLLITDILITDYSSVMFDFANTSKPMLFFTYDLENYRENIRGFYMDFEQEAPGPLVKNTDEIICNVLNIEQVKLDFQDKYTDFKQKYCSLEDGQATKRIVNELFLPSSDNK